MHRILSCTSSLSLPNARGPPSNPPPSHTYTHTLSLPHTHILTHTHSHARAHTHTPTHAHTLSHTHQVHWFSIMNSIIVVLVMATMVAFILIRTVRRDLSKYEQVLVDSSAMDLRDESGWKLVSGDVFRSPTGSRMMAVQVGVVLG